jgi:4-diphosphocytidyl-2-C-methyl-D-erythritol kinase
VRRSRDNNRKDEVGVQNQNPIYELRYKGTNMRFVDRLVVSRAEDSLCIKCPAKVNLFLKVLGKRSDGYHEVQNVMQTVTLFDELYVRRERSGLSLICSNEVLAEEAEKNLAYRAAELFFGQGHAHGGVRLELTKNIPIAAGLGGGSSDAACCLLALNELFASGLSPEELRLLAAELGSDVPFFVEGGTALCTGKGEVVTQLPPAPHFAGIVASPGDSMKTGEMYGRLTPEDFQGPEAEEMLGSIRSGRLENVCSALFNTFEKVALRAMPEIAALKKRLEDVGSVGSLLCGSGPTVFGVFPGLEQTERALGQLTIKRENQPSFSAAVSAF